MELVPCSLIKLFKSLLTEGMSTPSNRSLRAAVCFCATVLTKGVLLPSSVKEHLPLMRLLFFPYDTDILSPGTQKEHNFSQNELIVHDCVGKTLYHTPGQKICSNSSVFRSTMMITIFFYVSLIMVRLFFPWELWGAWRNWIYKLKWPCQCLTPNKEGLNSNFDLNDKLINVEASLPSESKCTQKAEIVPSSKLQNCITFKGSSGPPSKNAS